MRKAICGDSFHSNHNLIPEFYNPGERSYGHHPPVLLSLFYELRLRSPSPRVTLHLEGESPRRYFSRGSRLIVRSGDRVVFDRLLSSEFSLQIPIENAGGTIVIETDQMYVPAERSRRTQDRRHLGLRIFKCEIRRP